MELNLESNRAKKAAFLAQKDRENLSKIGAGVLEQYRSGWSVVEIAISICESEDTAIRISAIRSFIDRVNSIVSLIKSHVEGLSTTEIAERLNIEVAIALEELKWFQQSQIITQKGELWIHKKYESSFRES